MLTGDLFSILSQNRQHANLHFCEVEMGQRVTLKVNGGSTEGYLALPGGRGPGIIVIQEWWGLVPHIESIADRFADEGFVALAPDLYHGRTTKSPDEAGRLMMAMRVEEAERDLADAIRYLTARPQVSSKNIGTVGFCMGGALSLFAASKNPEVGACVVFYGGHPKIRPELQALQAPVLGIYAGRDGFVSPHVVKDLDDQLTRLGKRHEFHTYQNADHGFFNDQRPEVYDAAAAADAWAKTIAFFRREIAQ